MILGENHVSASDFLEAIDGGAPLLHASSTLAPLGGPAGLAHALFGVAGLLNCPDLLVLPALLFEAAVKPRLSQMDSLSSGGPR